MKDKHFTSRMLICAGGLMTVSGILFAFCAGLAYSGILFAAASCMFFAARNFRIAEDKKEAENQGEETEHEHKGNAESLMERGKQPVKEGIGDGKTQS